MMHQDSLEPAAIRRLERSLGVCRAPDRDIFSLLFSCIYIHRNPREWLILKYLWNLMVIVLFIKAYVYSTSRKYSNRTVTLIQQLAIERYLVANHTRTTCWNCSHIQSQRSNSQKFPAIRVPVYDMTPKFNLRDFFQQSIAIKCRNNSEIQSQRV